MIQRKKLGEIANISAGQGAPQGAENYSEEGTPFVKAGDLFYLVNGERECDIQKVSEEVAKNHRLKLYPKGTVLFAKSGMSCMKGYVYATNAECYVVSHLACIMPFDVDSKYLKYYFEYHKPNQLVKDASYPSISLADIAEMPINVFDDQTEAKIVDNLDAVNSLIAKSKEELGLLDNIVKSRFVEMFGDVKEKVPLSYYISGLCAGKSLAGEDECVNKVLKTGATTYDYFDPTQVKNLPLDYTPEEEHRVKTGDVIISRMNTAELVGAAAYVWEAPDHTYLPDRLWRAEVKDTACPIFVWQLLIQRETKESIRRIASGTSGSMKNISKPGLLGVRVIKAEKMTQNRFSAFVAQIDKSKLAVKQSLEKLETLKKSPMQKYFG